MLKLLDQEEMLKKIINSISNQDLEIKIGQENELEDIKKLLTCSSNLLYFK